MSATFTRYRDRGLDHGLRGMSPHRLRLGGTSRFVTHAGRNEAAAGSFRPTNYCALHSRADEGFWGAPRIYQRFCWFAVLSCHRSGRERASSWLISLRRPTARMASAHPGAAGGKPTAFHGDTSILDGGSPLPPGT